MPYAADGNSIVVIPNTLTDANSVVHYFCPYGHCKRSSISTVLHPAAAFRIDNLRTHLRGVHGVMFEPGQQTKEWLNIYFPAYMSGNTYTIIVQA